jgi:hypothetical protein
MSILERMNILQNEFKALCANPILSANAFTRNQSEEYGKDLKNRFKGLAFITHSGELFSRFGQIHKPPALSPEEMQHLRSGRTLVLTHTGVDTRSKMHMMRLINPLDRTQGILYGEINTFLATKSKTRGCTPIQDRTLCIGQQESGHLFHHSSSFRIA